MLANNSFGSRITQARIKFKMTKVALAKRVGCSNAAIGSWESGRAYPSDVNMSALAGALNVTIDWLNNGDVGGAGDNNTLITVADTKSAGTSPTQTVYASSTVDDSIGINDSDRHEKSSVDDVTRWATEKYASVLGVSPEKIVITLRIKT